MDVHRWVFIGGFYIVSELSPFLRGGYEHWCVVTDIEVWLR